MRYYLYSFVVVIILSGVVLIFTRIHVPFKKKIDIKKIDIKKTTSKNYIKNFETGEIRELHPLEGFFVDAEQLKRWGIYNPKMTGNVSLLVNDGVVNNGILYPGKIEFSAEDSICIGINAIGQPQEWYPELIKEK